MSNEKGKAELWILYHIDKEEGREKAFFNRVGHGFKNKDGSFTIKQKYLVADPDASLYFQKYTPREKGESESFSG